MLASIGEKKEVDSKPMVALQGAGRKVWCSEWLGRVPRERSGSTMAHTKKKKALLTKAAIGGGTYELSER